MKMYKKLLTGLLAVFLLLPMAVSVRADVATDFAGVKAGNDWIDLEEEDQEAFSGFFVAVPENVNHPENTKVDEFFKKIYSNIPPWSPYMFFSSGIFSDNGKPAPSPGFQMLIDAGSSGGGFDVEEKDSFIYADLSWDTDTTGDNNELYRGDSVDDLTISLSHLNWIAQPIFTELTGHDLYNRAFADGTLRFITDSQLVFTYKFPKGFDVEDAVITATNDQLLEIEKVEKIDNAEGGKNVIISLRRKNAGDNWLTNDDFKNELLHLDTVDVNLSGIKTTAELSASTHKVVATVGGYIAYANVTGSSIEEVRRNGLSWRYLHYFAAPQQKNHEDKHSGSTTVVSYTFDVKETPIKTVTFMNEAAVLAEVQVQKGKAIAHDQLLDQSMPANPEKEGFVFRGWNSLADGSGEEFTGESIVEEDRTVYAQFTKIQHSVSSPAKKPVVNTSVQ